LSANITINFSCGHSKDPSGAVTIPRAEKANQLLTEINALSGNNGRLSLLESSFGATKEESFSISTTVSDPQKLGLIKATISKFAFLQKQKAIHILSPPLKTDGTTSKELLVRFRFDKRPSGKSVAALQQLTLAHQLPGSSFNSNDNTLTLYSVNKFVPPNTFKSRLRSFTHALSGITTAYSVEQKTITLENIGNLEYGASKGFKEYINQFPLSEYSKQLNLNSAYLPKKQFPVSALFQERVAKAKHDLNLRKIASLKHAFKLNSPTLSKTLEYNLSKHIRQSGSWTSIGKKGKESFRHLNTGLYVTVHRSADKSFYYFTARKEQKTFYGHIGDFHNLANALDKKPLSPQPLLHICRQKHISQFLGQEKYAGQQVSI
jgi:hypothetical protein